MNKKKSPISPRVRRDMKRNENTVSNLLHHMPDSIFMSKMPEMNWGLLNLRSIIMRIIARFTSKQDLNTTEGENASLKVN